MNADVDLMASGPEPTLDEVMLGHILREKVADYLRQSNALEQYW